MKKFFEEFKAFALKGNMMDMAIGVIIGGAFSTLVTSLTDNLISPILGILGKVNFDAMMWDVFGDGKLVFKYGAFITAVINFLIMAFVLFCIVKAMNKLMEMGKHEEPAAEEPAAPAAPTQEELLAEILVELKKQNGEKTAYRVFSIQNDRAGRKALRGFCLGGSGTRHGRDESLPCGSTVNGRFREAAGRACPAPTARRTL